MRRLYIKKPTQTDVLGEAIDFYTGFSTLY